MAETTVAVDGLETLQVTLNLTAKVTFNDNLLAGDGGDDRSDLLGRKFLGADVGIDVGLFEDALGGLRADAVNVNERGFNTLVAWNFYAEESWHGVGSLELVAWEIVMTGRLVSALALFVTGILTDDAHHIVAADDLAGFAKAFDRGSDFHA